MSRCAQIWCVCVLAMLFFLVPLCACAQEPTPSIVPSPVLSPTPTPVQTITVSTATGEAWVLLGDTLQMTAEVEPENAANAAVAWSVSDTAIATIDASGLLTSHALGHVRVTARALDSSGAQASLEIEVRPILIERVLLSPSEKALMAGGRWPIEARILPDNATNPKLSWHSVDPAIAIAEQHADGSVTLVAKGKPGQTTSIVATAQDEGSVAAVCSLTITAPATDILVSTPGASIPVTRINRGDTFILSAEVLPSDASSEVLWKSGDPSIATVVAGDSGRATVTGTGGGQVMLQALAQDGSGASGRAELFVRVPIESVALAESASMFIGTQKALTPTFAPTDTTDRVLRWSSLNPDVAAVDAQGVVHALSVGEAYITAHSAANSSIVGECQVSVTQPVTTIVLQAETMVIGQGSSMRVRAAVSPLNANDRSLLWHSSDNAVATVDESGRVCAIAKGTAIIQASACDGSGVTSALSIEVRNQLESIALPDEMSVMPGESFRLTPVITPLGLDPGPIAWTSSNEQIARVSRDGAVTGVAAGEASISAKTGNGMTASCMVRVSVALSSIEVYSDSGALPLGEELIIDIGQSRTLYALARPAGIKVDFLYQSRNKKIASAGIDGTITARGIGLTSVLITARPMDGIKAVTRTLKVRVIRPVESVTLDTPIQVLAGYTARAKATIAPAGATYKQLTWAVADRSIATVDAKGAVTGVHPGTTLLTAMSHNLVVAMGRVEVVEPIGSISLSLPEDVGRINPGGTVKMSAGILPASAGQAVKWSSSNTAVARVSQDGVVTARAPGTAKIAVTAVGGNLIAATVKITVAPAVRKLALSHAQLNLFTNGSARTPRSYRLKTKLSPASVGVRPITWASSNPAIATVDEKGLVTALSDGVALITAATENNRSAQTVVQVRTLPSAISFGQAQYELAPRGALNLLSELTLDGTDEKLFWKSSDASVVRVNQSGEISARKKGKAKITVVARNGLKAVCAVRVSAPLPAQTPAEQPALTPAEQPAQTPAEQPPQASAEQPAQASAEQPAQTPAEQPPQTPAEQPAQASAEQPAQTPAEQPAQASAEQPPQASAEQPAQASAEQPAQASAEQPPPLS